MFPDIYSRPSSEDINALPQKIYEGPIELIRSVRQWDKYLPDMESADVIGFDTETRPSFRKGLHYPPALIQLATANRVYLVQLKFMPFGMELAQILSSRSIKKAGVAINTDMIALGQIFPFKPEGIVDLGEMGKLNNLPNHGLRTLAASLFGWRIAKGEQCSNWNAKKLTGRQITYAATDAWISRLIYLRMVELGLRETP